MHDGGHAADGAPHRVTIGDVAADDVFEARRRHEIEAANAVPAPNELLCDGATDDTGGAGHEHTVHGMRYGSSYHAVSLAQKAWLVDLDGTLYLSGPVKLAMAAELALAGPGSALLLRRFRHEHEAVRSLGLEGDPFRLQIERTAEALGVSPTEVEARVRAWMIDRPGKWLGLFRRRDMLSQIRAFRAQGGVTALVSDYPARQKLAALGASDLFDVVVASGEPGGPTRLKPHPTGMLMAADALHVEPKDCLVIGDREDADGVAARAAGMAFRLVGR
jgi:FMN phosphatase YigB (HAD superfamily)